ncbi:MAG: ferrous iron transporter B [Mogibacterium sp.]|nr:ferrous iron transporter B [Mogibacterium sp.]MBQ6500252.1 ferrous iron transporter B [Mogibacterium sp.]
MRIAFAGNPNSGKTTMYNALTGRNEKIGNWGGVTVGSKEFQLKKEFAGDKEVIAVDLPGAYSMSPFTPEEGITSEYVRTANPDAIVNIVDATNLSRSLFFTTQLLELGIPVVVALNKTDINEKEGTKIDAAKLSAKLNCPVFETVSTENKGLAEMIAKAISLAGTIQKAPYLQADIDLHDKNAVDAEDRKRYSFVNGIVADVETRKTLSAETNKTDKLDSVLLNPIAGIIIFAAVMFAVFQISQAEGPLGIGKIFEGLFTGWIETFQGWVAAQLENSPAIVSAILADGIVGGVGAVVGFLPLVMVMYFLIALLEDCGYMARVSAVMDPIFKRVGLSGKAVIPVIIGTGCGIPAIMACRTIRDERERRTSTMLTTFIPCGAKIPVIALFAGAFFNGAGWVSTLSYFLGIVLIFLGALLIKSITGYKYRKSFFIMELPKWKVPSLKYAVRSMLERAKAYIIKAATIILICNTLVQVMQTFNWHFQVVEEGAENTSILATIASPFAFLLIPLGFGVWQLAAAAITGFIAKENVVGTLATVFALTSFIDTEELAMTGGASTVATTMGLTTVTALAYLFFNLYTPPCFAAIGAMNSEMKSRGWLWGAIGLQLGTGYTIAFLVYQFGTLFTEGHFGTGFIPGLIAVLCMVAALILIGRKVRAHFDEQYQLHKAAKAAKATA